MSLSARQTNKPKEVLTMITKAIKTVANSVIWACALAVEIGILALVARFAFSFVLPVAVVLLVLSAAVGLFTGSTRE